MCVCIVLIGESKKDLAKKNKIFFFGWHLMTMTIIFFQKRKKIKNFDTKNSLIKWEYFDILDKFSNYIWNSFFINTQKHCGNCNFFFVKKLFNLINDYRLIRIDSLSMNIYVLFSAENKIINSNKQEMCFGFNEGRLFIQKKTFINKTTVFNKKNLKLSDKIHAHFGE